jgi:hypothetical protein
MDHGLAPKLEARIHALRDTAAAVPLVWCAAFELRAQLLKHSLERAARCPPHVEEQLVSPPHEETIYGWAAAREIERDAVRFSGRP